LTGYTRKEIRAIVLARDNNRCTICGREATNIVAKNPAHRTDWKARESLRASCMMTDCKPAVPIENKSEVS